MTFPARLFIQGVGCYVPHVDGKQLLVLFPDQDHNDVGTLPRPGGQEICDHYTAVQMDARSIDENHPELWMSLDVHKQWIGVQAGGSPKMTGVESKLGQFLPAMGGILEAAGYSQFAALRNDVLPGGAAVSERLKGGLFLDVGDVKSYKPFQSRIKFVWSDESSLDTAYEMTATSVVEVDLGDVSDLHLIFRPLGGATAAAVKLHPVGGKLEVWIRHFCNLERPKEPEIVESGNELDADFVLSYALRNELERLLQETGGLVPVPSTIGPPGGKPRQCMGDLESAALFENPLLT